MAFTMTLGVSTDGLKNKSYEVGADIESMAKDFKVMSDEIIGTSQYWLGSAGEIHRKKLDNSINEINSILERLRTYPVRILEMAGLYESTEYENAILSSNLTTTIDMN